MDAAKAIRNARRRAGLSQAQLATRAGTSQPAVARYESGTSTPALATLERLLAACGSSVVLAARERRTAPALPRGSLGAALRRSRARLRAAGRRHGIHHIRVFGSVARGEDKRGSDVDLLVELEPDRTLLDLIGFRQDAEEILGVRVDAAAPRFMKDRVRRRALRDARPM